MELVLNFADRCRIEERKKTQCTNGKHRTGISITIFAVSSGLTIKRRQGFFITFSCTQRCPTLTYLFQTKQDQRFGLVSASGNSKIMLWAGSGLRVIAWVGSAPEKLSRILILVPVNNLISQIVFRRLCFGLQHIGSEFVRFSFGSKNLGLVRFCFREFWFCLVTVPSFRNRSEP